MPKGAATISLPQPLPDEGGYQPDDPRKIQFQLAMLNKYCYR